MDWSNLDASEVREIAERIEREGGFSHWYSKWWDGERAQFEAWQRSRRELTCDGSFGVRPG